MDHKPFTRPDHSTTATCWDCGYTWTRGQDGSHSCISHLQAHYVRLAERVRELESAERESEFTRILDERGARLAALEEENRALRVHADAAPSRFAEMGILREKVVALEAEVERLRVRAARIRQDLLEELPMDCASSGGLYYKGWSAAAELARATLDRILPEAPHHGPAHAEEKG